MAKKLSSKSYRLAWFSFIFAVVVISLGIVEEITIGEHTVKLRMIDPLLALAFTGPAYALYGLRQYTKARWYRSELDERAGE